MQMSSTIEMTLPTWAIPLVRVVAGAVVDAVANEALGDALAGVALVLVKVAAADHASAGVAVSIAVIAVDDGAVDLVAAVETVGAAVATLGG